MNEATIKSLLENEHDWQQLIYELEHLGRNRGDQIGYEAHHIEPERVEIIYLTPFEHLAIHICHAKLNTNRSTCAAVAAFVRVWPGSYRRILELSTDLRESLISFGQSGGDGGSLNEHPNTLYRFANRTEAQRQQAAENGRKGAEKTRATLLGRKIVWADKISKAAQSKPQCCCIRCGKEMKAIGSNITQHQRSSKCKK